jgi:serine/threonine-protein kinase PpkA
VARIYDQSFTGDNPYLAMEFLPSGTLAGQIRGGISSRDALRITSQIAHALDAIHAKGIVHRDLKPANILFRTDGRPVIVDFGLAKDLALNSTLTMTGQLLATPRYMSPEQCLGHAVDGRSDLYSLGVIFYEMLTGQRIFQPADAMQVINMHVQAPVPQLPAQLAGYQSILDRLLAKKPEDRFQSARELFGLIAT